MKRHYFPDMSQEQIAEILSRAGDDFWSALERRQVGEQYLMGWLLNLMVLTEASNDPVYGARAREEAARRFAADPEVDSTMSWLSAIAEMAKARHVPLRLFLIPTGDVDPTYAAFWKPWPRFYSWQLRANAWLEPLAAKLRRAAVPIVDLREDLEGVPGTYRVMDGHWTERGVDIVARRVHRELMALIGN